MAKTPLTRVKDTFGDKKKLVEAVEKFTSDDLWVARTNKDKGLAHVSNAKLLRLYDTFTAVKEKFGTRAQLIEAILEVEKRTKDDGYRKHLSAWPVPRLWDAFKSVSKRNAPPKEKAAAKKAAAPKKAAASPAKKTAKKAAGATKKKPSKKG